jgi:hypothetical protein
MDPRVILQRFQKPTSGQDMNSSSEEDIEGMNYRQLRHLVDNAVEDPTAKSSQKLHNALHSIQAQSELLQHENQGLRISLATKKKQAKKSKPLDLQQQKEYYGSAVWWSPRKVSEANARKAVKQQLEEEENQKKTEKETESCSFVV